jgi:rhamnogalacturonyl hydrolase YesR
VDALITLQDATGLWRSVPESAHAWIETSGSAMILTAIAAGVREGLLEEALIPVVQRGLLELSSWIRPEGIERVDPRAGALMGVQGPAGAGGWQTHKLATVGEYSYGTAFVLMLLAEMRGAGWE